MYGLGFERDKEIIEFLKKLKEKFKLSKIILFGSRAKGDYLEDSDYDFIIVSNYFENISFLKRMELIYKDFDLDVNVDIIPITEKEYKKRKNELSILGEGIRKGIEIEI